MAINAATKRGQISTARTAAEKRAATGIPASYLDAAIAVAAGDFDRAKEVGRSAVAEAEDLPYMLATYSFQPLARVAERTGDAETAARLRPRIEPLRGSFLANEVAIYGAAEGPLGLIEATLGNLDTAVELLTYALDAAREREWHALVAEHLIDLARVLQERNGPDDHKRARELATEAFDAADRLDMAVVRREATEVLDAAPTGRR